VAEASDAGRVVDESAGSETVRDRVGFGVVRVPVITKVVALASTSTTEPALRWRAV